MPKTKISEFSSTPASNTDIDSINIAENCPPSGINDAIRELMSQLKDWQSGTSNDPYVVGSSGSLTLNQGTANGVAYLNGSKVVTSGSALTFDGTNFAVGTQGEIRAYNTANTRYGRFVTTSDGTILESFNGAGEPLILSAPQSSAYIGFKVNASEQMRLTSTGLGIGTSSPTSILNVSSSVNNSTTDVEGQVRILNTFSGGVAALAFSSNGSDGQAGRAGITAGKDSGSTTGYLAFATRTNVSAFTEAARINSSGALLVGTTSNSFASSLGLIAGSAQNGGQGVYDVYNSSTSVDSDPAPCMTFHKGSTLTTSSARFLQFYAGVSATPMGGIVGNGASNVQFASISDVREKTNISPISGSLEKIVALKPVEFDWIANGEHCPAGFVAQDVEQVFPEFVVENMANTGQETRKGLTGGMTGGIVAHLVKAIQEQQAIINQLKARLDAANL